MAKSLTEILNGNDDFFDDWDAVQAADEFGPIPPGEYITHLIGSEPFNAKTGTPGYKLAFKILEGELTDRQVWYDIWLTDAAKAQAKRDFAKLGITDPKRQLAGPLPPGIRCNVKVVLQLNDKGEEYNKVKRFDVLGIDPPEAEPFAPPDYEKGEF